MNLSGGRQALAQAAPGVPWYPALISGIYVLDLAFAHNLPAEAFIRPLSVAVLGALALTIVLWASARDRHMGGLLAFGILAALASREPLRQLVVLLNLGLGVRLGVIALVLALVIGLVLAAALAVRLVRQRAKLGPRVTRTLNVIALILAAVVIIPALGFYLDSKADLAPLEATPADASLPDIYLVVLDGQPRHDVLQDTYDTDIGPFLDALRSRDFVVAEESYSNYTYTSLTLASLMNLDYLEAAADGDAVVPQPELRRNFRWLARNGDLSRTIRAAGYTVVATDSGWEHVTLRGFGDRFLSGSEMTELETGLLLQTWIPDLPWVGHDWLLAPRRAVTERTFDDATRLASETHEPMFALVHVPSPHMPIAFSGDGGPVPWGSRELYAATPREYGLTADAFNDAYREQLDYLHGRVLHLVDAIAEGARPAVVILVSDHGSSPEEGNDLRELLPNFVAVRALGLGIDQEDVGTPLNALRLVLQHHLNAPLPPLEPRYWVAREDQGRIFMSETRPLR